MKNGADPTDPISASEIAGVADAVEALVSGAISPDAFRRRRRGEQSPLNLRPPHR